MNRRLLTILLFAFLVALGCSLVVYRLVGRRIAAAAQPKAESVIVAATDIKIGTILHDGDLKMAQMVGPLPKGAILKKEDAINRGVIANVYQAAPSPTSFPTSLHDRRSDPREQPLACRTKRRLAFTWLKCSTAQSGV